MEMPAPVLQEHSKLFDEKCPICTCKQRTLLEKWYVQRRPIGELVSIFKFPEALLHLHARAVKIHKKRAHNTAAIVDLVLESGTQKLVNGEMELTVKDLQWAVGHRDKLLGRISERVDINIPPILHLHTTIPGVGGIADSDIKTIAGRKIMEALPSAADIVLNAEVVPEPTKEPA